VLNNACVAGDVVVTQGYTLSSIANALPSTGGTVTGATTFNSTVSINGANGSGYTGYKNRIINGGMVIDQRNAGASVTNTTSVLYVTDRFAILGSASSKFTGQQNAGSVTPPVGYINYLGLTSSSAYSISSSDFFITGQLIEGLNVADLAWGTANAAPVTLSFWVRSSLTGTFGGAISNSAQNRSYPFSYTISSANTWEQKTVTIAGDTSGTWLTTNGIGIRVWLGLGVGSTYSTTAGAWAAGLYLSATGATSVVGTNGATFYITGVQLERGSNATSFEFRDYGRELIMCQRYLPAITFDSGTYGYSAVASGFAYLTTGAIVTVPFSVKARTGASGISVSNTGSFSVLNSSGGLLTATAITANSSSDSAANIVVTVASGLTAGNGTSLVINNANARLLFTGCEL
jgi:hypothetical protein